MFLSRSIGVSHVAFLVYRNTRKREVQCWWEGNCSGGNLQVGSLRRGTFSLSRRPQGSIQIDVSKTRENPKKCVSEQHANRVARRTAHRGHIHVQQHAPHPFNISSWFRDRDANRDGQVAMTAFGIRLHSLGYGTLPSGE
jgi:hypothetical protein